MTPQFKISKYMGNKLLCVAMLAKIIKSKLDAEGVLMLNYLTQM